MFSGMLQGGRTAPPVKPSAQPFSPRLRSTAGAHINPCGPTGWRKGLGRGRPPTRFWSPGYQAKLRRAAGPWRSY